MITALYQNSITGDTHDITNIITAAKHTTKRQGAAKLEFTALRTTVVSWEPGSILAVKDDSYGTFYGYHVKDEGDRNADKITAYDQLWYMKNADTYVFKGKRADEVVRKLCSDYQIKIGELVNTKHVIPSLIEDGKPLIDIALKSIDLTLIETSKMFCLWDDFGAIALTDIAQNHVNIIIGDRSIATNYTLTREIESDTANRIKLVRDNNQTGKRDVYIIEDTATQVQWGLLQHFEKVDESLNPAQIEEKCKNLLKLKNRPLKTLKLPTMARIPEVRGGRAIFVEIAERGIAAYMIVEEAIHDLLNNTMELTVRVV